MKEIVFFLEERSAQVMLDGLLPRLLPPGVTYRCIAFSGKSDMEKKLLHRMRHYLNPESRFVVLRDQDSGDCRQIKARLADLCVRAGKPHTLVRIACRELESWYLGDLAAVERGLRLSGLALRQKAAKFRNPDRLNNAYQELEKLTNNAYRKVLGSRAIGPFLDLENTRSASFAAFVSGVRRLLEIERHTDDIGTAES